jgi:hypothetical protein
MRKTVLYFFSQLLFSWPLLVFPQPNTLTGNTVNEVKEKFLQNLNATFLDSTIVHPLARYFESEVNSIDIYLRDTVALPVIEKEKAIRSLVYFIEELNGNLAQRKLDIYDIPGALQSYKQVLMALLFPQPMPPILEPLGPGRSQLISAAFSQYPEHSLLDDIATYKRVASSPEFILQFVESKPDFRFADSLLLDAGAHDPQKIIFYLNSTGPGVQGKIRKTENSYLKQIAALADDKNVSELLPFVMQIADKKITTEEILEKRFEASAYFQLLVNTLQELIIPADPGSIFLEPLRSGIKQKSISFYVNGINDQHGAPEAIRFAPIKGLRSQDLYYIITSCGEELYTSSYLGLYKKLMENFKGRSTDSLLDIVHYDNFRVFIRLAANYNVLDDFLHSLSPERMREVLQQFIAGIEKNRSTALERAMDIADCFTTIDSSIEISELIQTELQSNLSRCTSGQNYLGTRLYTILLEIFGLVKQKNGITKLWSTLGDYEILKHAALENKNGEVVELVLFYGDEDGVSSFSNFLKLYTDKRKWEITKNENWISIRSLSDQLLTIYANRPLDIKQEMDLKAQDSLIDFLKMQSLEPTILVHRGHSYHLDKTMRRLTPSVKLAILGSCGGYNKAISIANISPDVQVIGSKKTGSKSINDPIIDVINQTLIIKKDISWPDTWEKLSARFNSSEGSRSLFNEYFPPSDNVSLFVLKLFMGNRASLPGP